ncbi:MAG: hypothetical protein MJZ73_11305 [Bacteroidaceae bacterium]|nr:hypothetical protein [Bacteroidaceae bacterium]
MKTFRLLALWIAVVMTSMSFAAYASGRGDEAVDPDLKKTAEYYQQLFESGNWVLVPTQANYPRTITFNDLNKESNYFRCIDGKLHIRTDFTGSRVTHALSDEQVYALAAESAELYGFITVPPPIFMAEATVDKKEVRVSKKYKSVTLQLHCTMNSSNWDDFNAMPRFTVFIDTRTGDALITCMGMRYNESYRGTIFEAVVDNSGK